MHLSGCQFLAAFAAAAHLFASVAQADDREPLKQLGYDKVHITGGPFAEQYDWVHGHYLSLSNDNLLKVYRQNAGMNAPGEDMGGWYDYDGFVPGHALGQFISGIARIGANTGDPACHEKVHALVSGFAETLGANNTSILRPETNLWICYTLDKHFIGLIDAATLSNISEAVPLLSRVLDGALSIIPAEGHDRIGVHNLPYDEPFVMPENLYTAAALTSNPTFTDYAQRYLLNSTFFDVLSAGGDPLPGQQAYSHAIALSSGAKAYLVTGDSRYSEAIHHAFHLLTAQQQYASGGWGPNEAFVDPHQGELGASLSNTTGNFETPCGSYAATKLARYLLRITSSPNSTAHGDYLERVLFNAILGVKKPDSLGDYFYYSNYTPQAEKVYYPSKWPCCSATLVQTVSDYPLNVAFGNERDLYVNLYTPSTIQHTFGNTQVTLQQDTDFPITDTSKLTIDVPHDVNGTIALRIPAWCARSATVKLNGKPLANGTTGVWLELARTWSTGDTLNITLPQDFHLEPIDEQNDNTVALMRGPVQYVMINPPTGFPDLPPLSNFSQAGSQIYTANGFTFVPFYLTGNDQYATYFTRT